MTGAGSSSDGSSPDGSFPDGSSPDGSSSDGLPRLGPRRLGPGAVGLLLLADGRFPAGAYAHSFGMEEAVAEGHVRDVADVTAYAAGVLHTAGLVSAGLAALACRLAAGGSARRGRPGGGAGDGWVRLQAECDARMPSPAQRRTSRQLGRQLWRAAGAMAAVAGGAQAGDVPPDLGGGADGPHHAVALGVVTAALGGGPGDAALLAALGAVSGVVHAAVRLLGLDPVAAVDCIAGLGPALEELAAEGAATVSAGAAPAPSAPLLDHYAEARARREWTMFAS